MGYANLKGIKVIWKREKAKKVWYIEYEGDIVSEGYRSRPEAINSLEPLIQAMRKHWDKTNS